MANEIQRLLPRHFEILNLVLGGNGPKEIAQALGITPQSVSGVINSPLFQTELSRRREIIETKVDENLALAPMRAKEVLDQAALPAAQTLVNFLSHSDARIAQKSATEILDRVIGNNSKTSPVVVLEPGAIQILQIAMQESRDARTERLKLKEAV